MKHLTDYIKTLKICKSDCKKSLWLTTITVSDMVCVNWYFACFSLFTRNTVKAEKCVTPLDNRNSGAVFQMSPVRTAFAITLDPFGEYDRHTVSDFIRGKLFADETFFIISYFHVTFICLIKGISYIDMGRPWQNNILFI